MAIVIFKVIITLWKRMLNNDMRKCSNSKNKTVGFFSLLMLVYGQNDQMLKFMVDLLVNLLTTQPPLWLFCSYKENTLFVPNKCNRKYLNLKKKNRNAMQKLHVKYWYYLIHSFYWYWMHRTICQCSNGSL